VEERDALKERAKGEIEQLEINLKSKYLPSEDPLISNVVYGS
jgi:hypothetical protein